MNEKEKEILEAALLEKEKTFIDRMGWSAFLTALVLAAGIISSFAVSNYRQGEHEKLIIQQQVQINDLKREKEDDGRTITVVVTEMKSLNNSIIELKEQNKETYRLLLDISKRQ